MIHNLTMTFSNLLTGWYLQHKRDLPWRKTQNPYAIWLSEIMLQQTRVAQGLPYFLSFIENFPTVFDLATANEEKVLKLWQGLGYYSRARNLHQTAKIVAFEMDGIFPNNYKDLQKLKGIGEYTAAAIASFSYNECVPVVDGNVFRVLSRYFDVDTDIASAKAKKEFQELALQVIDESQPALFNQAIMEFGALQCVPKNPNCTICVFNNSCSALQKNKVNILPIKSKKVKVKNRFLNYLIFEDAQQKTTINKRTEKGIWQNLYEFPLIETNEKQDYEIFCAIIKEQFHENEILSVHEINTKSQLHKLTHQNLYIKFWKIIIQNNLENGIDIDELKTFPFPIVIHNFIEKHFL